MNSDDMHLIYLPDADVVWFVEQWSVLHPKKERGDLGLDSSDVSQVERAHEWRQLHGKIVRVIDEPLSYVSLLSLK